MDTYINASHQCMVKLLQDIRARQKAMLRLLIHVHSDSKYRENELMDLFENAYIQEFNETCEFLLENFGIVDIQPDVKTAEEVKVASDIEEEKKV